MRVMRWVFFSVGVLILSAVSIAYLIGYFSAPDFVGQAQVEIAKPQSEVWATLSDPAKVAAWSPGIEKVEPAGDNTWKYTGKQASSATTATMRYEVRQPGTKLRTSMIGSPQQVSGVWTYTLSSAGDTRTKVQVDAALHVNDPWLRAGIQMLTDVGKQEGNQLTLLKKYLESK